MSLWGDIGRGALSAVTGGIYKPGGKGPKMPKLEGEKKQHKEVVGKTKQAGGAQINYNAEEMVDDVPGAGKPRPIIAPRQSGRGSQNFLNQMKDKATTYLQSQSQGTGWRSEAARKLLEAGSKYQTGASDGGGKWL